MTQSVALNACVQTLDKSDLLGHSGLIKPFQIISLDLVLTIAEARSPTEWLNSKLPPPMSLPYNSTVCLLLCVAN